MKEVKLMLALVILLGIGTVASAQEDKKTAQKTETFKVWGECDMCKSRIEKAAKAEGAITAVWDGKTDMLTVVFDPSKTSVDALSKKMSSIGHDTEKYKATADVYEKLPGCCQYERAK
jgi:periplasmic mercuric ion binding protein